MGTNSTTSGKSISDLVGSDGLALKRLNPTLTSAPAVISAWLRAVDSFKGNRRRDWHSGTKMAPPPTPAVEASDPTCSGHGKLAKALFIV